MNNKKLTIVIPVRDEAETISDTITQLQKTVITSHEIIVADDHINTFDRTYEEVHALQKKYKNIVWLSKKATDRDGFGPCLCRAIHSVTTPYTVVVMSDSCDDAKTIDCMYKEIPSHQIDIVCGSRYGKGGKKIGGPPLQNILSWLLNNSLYVFGFPTHDATNAFKLYNTKFLKHILPKSPSTGVEFSFELSLLAKKQCAKWKDVATIWTGRTKGESKVRLFARGPKYLQLLFRLL
jgi:glycosyltransferase involved in cell wall biosynthesis